MNTISKKHRLELKKYISDSNSPKYFIQSTNSQKLKIDQASVSALIFTRRVYEEILSGTYEDADSNYFMIFSCDLSNPLNTNKYSQRDFQKDSRKLEQSYSVDSSKIDEYGSEYDKFSNLLSMITTSSNEKRKIYLELGYDGLIIDDFVYIFDFKKIKPVDIIKNDRVFEDLDEDSGVSKHERKLLKDQAERNEDNWYGEKKIQSIFDSILGKNFDLEMFQRFIDNKNNLSQIIQNFDIFCNIVVRLSAVEKLTETLLKIKSDKELIRQFCSNSDVIDWVSKRDMFKFLGILFSDKKAPEDLEEFKYVREYNQQL